MKFIEKKPVNKHPLSLYLTEEREYPPEYEGHAMNFSLITSEGQELASGRCSLQKDDNDKDYLYISAIYVEGNSNYPTRKNPNRYSGLGMILVFAAVKFGVELNIHTVKLLPVDGSHGFYLKMGFYPKSNDPNHLVNEGQIDKITKGRINTEWLMNFERRTFLNPSFRQSTWVGNAYMILPVLRSTILKSWDIIT
ncbi:GNAT family N-acetyltransferase [Enterobacter cloacae]|uniref:GNAT family N-acetyltransferase n=1 Tax=Enterobacter cloacae TaxID=550 RepID=UPI0034A16427